MYDGALADMGLDTDPFTGSRYAFGDGNPISNIELDGHTHCDVGICPTQQQTEQVTQRDQGGCLLDCNYDPTPGQLRYMRHLGYRGSKWASTAEIAHWLSQDVPVNLTDEGWDFFCQGLAGATPSQCRADPFTKNSNIYWEPSTGQTIAGIGLPLLLACALATEGACLGGLPALDIGRAGAAGGEGVLVEGAGSGTRVINFRPDAADPNWGLTSAHLEKHLFGSGPLSLSTIDPGGNPDLWFSYIQDLASRPATATLKGGIEDIIGTFPKTGGNGTFQFGIRIAPAGNGTFDLVTLLTKQ
jgi:hypothetical protein